MFYPLLKTLLLPPTLNLLLLLLAWLLARRWRRTGYALGLLALALLWLISTPYGALWLTARLEPEPLERLDLYRAQALVVLGGGRYPAAPEYAGQDLPGLLAQQRLIYAAELHQRSGLPILTSGGLGMGMGMVMGMGMGQQSEAALMAKFLQQRLHTEVWAQEEGSRTTWENARYSAPLLQKAGIERIVLISQAWHLPRARFAFEAQGLTVFPAATGYYRPRPWRFPGQYGFPEPEAFAASYWVLHEALGLGWYRLKHILEQR